MEQYNSAIAQKWTSPTTSKNNVYIVEKWNLQIVIAHRINRLVEAD